MRAHQPALPARSQHGCGAGPDGGALLRPSAGGTGATASSPARACTARSPALPPPPHAASSASSDALVGRPARGRTLTECPCRISSFSPSPGSAGLCSTACPCAGPSAQQWLCSTARPQYEPSTRECCHRRGHRHARVCYGGRRSSQPGAAEGSPAQAAAQNRVGLGRRTDGHVDPGRAARALGGRDQAAARAAHARAGRAPLGDLPAGGHHARSSVVSMPQLAWIADSLAHVDCSPCARTRPTRLAPPVALRLSPRALPGGARAPPSVQRSFLPRWLTSCSSAPPCSAKPRPHSNTLRTLSGNCRRK